MKVKTFLNKLNIGRSDIDHVVIEDVNTKLQVRLDRGSIYRQDYGDWGDSKVNSITLSGVVEGLVGVWMYVEK